jgi:crotonobetainyl-CoA:carnitine CoA-transferase CaiB-like acyl-CoA transferase
MGSNAADETGASPMSAAGGGALAGLRVLDATQMLAGPLAAARLGDLGAEVIKIEAPVTGEFNRTHGFEDVVVRGEMSTFLALNRNKRSLALDLKNPASQKVLADLVAESDVFIQNFRHGTAERLGAGYEQLSAINPRLVYCSISGYGPTGPYRDRPGQDLVVQGYSGSMFSTGKLDDPPQPSALWAADAMTGYQAAIGILAAIEARHRIGRGQHVQIDMLSVVLDSQLQEIVTFLNSGRQPTRGVETSAHASIPAPYGVYKTKDGWLTIAMTELSRLGEVLDDDWLRTLTAYNDGAIHRDEVYARIRDSFLGRDTDEWMALCDAAGMWTGPVYDYEALSRDPHIIETGMFVDQPHRDGGTVRTVRVPISLSETQPSISRGAPALGADSVAILSELGYEQQQIDALIAAGSVASVVDGEAAEQDETRRASA